MGLPKGMVRLRSTGSFRQKECFDFSAILPRSALLERWPLRCPASKRRVESDRRVSVGPFGLHKPIRSRPTRPWWRSIGSRFWCCHRSNGRWRAGSRSGSSDRRGDRDIRGSRNYTSSATGHLLRLPSLRISRLRVSGLRAAGLRIPRLLGIPRPRRSSGLWISGLLGRARLLRSSGLWIPRLLGTAR
jgi:hypothetical protein